MERMFRVETHLHTAETSSCGFVSGADFVDMYHLLGYDTIFVTDHLSNGFVSSVNCKNDWNACIDLFLTGYKRAKKQGKKVGLNVLLGAEIRFTEPNASDYLIYGISERFLRKNPYFFRTTPQDFFKRYGDEVLIIQAHPFRGGNETVFSDSIHGIELYNSNPRHTNYTDKALEFIKNHPKLYHTSGSDAHRENDTSRGWMLFDRPIVSSCEFIDAVRHREYILGKV